MKNPPWSTDELIVTLDFYIRHSPNIPRKTSEEIKSLIKNAMPDAQIIIQDLAHSRVTRAS